MNKNEIKILSNEKYVKESLEYQLIEYVNNDPFSIIENPVNEISKRLHVDTSSLARAVRRIGFKSYKTFRNFVTEKISKHKKHLINNYNQNSNALFNDSIVNNILTIKETIKINDNDEFDEVVNEIINAKKVFLFGIGFTFFICQHLTKYLEFSGINCCNTLNFYDALQFASFSKDNIWIIISITLKTKEMIFLLEELIANNNNKIIVITANYTHTILKKVAYVLKLKSNDLIKNEVFNLNFKIGLTALVNLIILKVLDKINSNKKK